MQPPEIISLSKKPKVAMVQHLSYTASSLHFALVVVLLLLLLLLTLPYLLLKALLLPQHAFTRRYYLKIFFLTML
jgi:hypothetical protein